MLTPIPDGTASRLLARLADVSGELDAHGVTRSHDLYGRTFQRLISDRKFLATFYTLPESAALLAELAAGVIDVDWADPEAVTGLRACDFACGTGTLITAAYHALPARHRRAGGDDAAIHRRMMAFHFLVDELERLERRLRIVAVVKEFANRGRDARVDCSGNRKDASRRRIPHKRRSGRTRRGSRNGPASSSVTTTAPSRCADRRPRGRFRCAETVRPQRLTRRSDSTTGTWGSLQVETPSPQQGAIAVSFATFPPRGIRAPRPPQCFTANRHGHGRMAAPQG